MDGFDERPYLGAIVFFVEENYPPLILAVVFQMHRDGASWTDLHAEVVRVVVSLHPQILALLPDCERYVSLCG